MSESRADFYRGRFSCWLTVSHISEELEKLVLLGTSWWKFSWNGAMASKRIIPFLTDSPVSNAFDYRPILFDTSWIFPEWTFVNYGHGTEAQTCEWSLPVLQTTWGTLRLWNKKNKSGSSCGVTIAVNSGQCDALTRRNIKTCQYRRLKRVQSK